MHISFEYIHMCGKSCFKGFMTTANNRTFREEWHLYIKVENESNYYENNKLIVS